MLVLSNYGGATSDLCPRSLLTRVLGRAADAGFVPKYGMELEYTLFDETPESAREKGYRNLKTATMHKSHGRHSLSVHRNGTPARYPRKSGGSPMGSRVPPMLLTMKMKKTTVCATRVR